MEKCLSVAVFGSVVDVLDAADEFAGNEFEAGPESDEVTKRVGCVDFQRRALLRERERYAAAAQERFAEFPDVCRDQFADLLRYPAFTAGVAEWGFDFGCMG